MQAIKQQTMEVLASVCRTDSVDHAGEVPVWKRVVDLMVMLVLLPALVIFFVGISILIKLVSRGPVFFTQDRVGYKGRIFKCYKFRTMHPQADAGVHASHVADLLKSNKPMKKLDSAGDKRLIPFGRHLRASGLDELPQLINVLKGEMSIVGPRPCTTYEFSMYQPHHKERVNALPGLTGLWQVSGKNKTTFEQMIALDIKYARSASAWLDLQIIARTFPTLFNQVAEQVGAKAAAAFKTSVSSRQTLVAQE